MTTAIIPIPRCELAIRPGVASDIPFIDRLQKMHSHMVGWMPTKQLEGKIAAGHVLVAEERHEGTEARRHEGSEGSEEAQRQEVNPLSPPSLVPHSVPRCLRASVPLGYVIGHDQYMKRDDLGIIYQLNVVPLKQRNLIGAMLIKAMFERAAYGCRLFCCWCAQDIQANYFWESIGFIPLAFRTGSASKQRTHIFWQRRIREGDATTPYWFPAQTSAGALGEERLVLPIPPGTDWRDAKPLILPSGAPDAPKAKALPPTRPSAPPVSVAKKVAVIRSQSKHLGGLPAGKAAIITSGGMRYIDRGDYVPEPEPVAAPKPKRERKPRAKHDPADIAKARELRDRYLEQFNSGLVLPAGKYEVSRQIEAGANAAPMLLEQKAA